VERLAEALRYEPCSPTCANWLRYGIQPKNSHPGLVPGACKGKAHRYDHLGYAGRRVLVSRKWSGKTLADHRGDRKAWLTEMLGLPATDPTHYRWEQVEPDDEDYLPSGRRLLRSVADRLQWETLSPKPDDEPRRLSPQNFRQRGGQRNGQVSGDPGGTALDSGRGGRAAEHD
jgi:replication initiator protein RepSA